MAEFMHPPAGLREPVQRAKWKRIGLYCHTYQCKKLATWALQFEHNGFNLTTSCDDHKPQQAKEWRGAQ